MSKWALQHKNELPFLVPKVINTGCWKKVTQNSIAELSGIYLFICSGDNHLIYEVHEIPQGYSLLLNFTEGHEHTDGWAVVKPIYYYYVMPLNKTAN